MLAYHRGDEGGTHSNEFTGRKIREEHGEAYD